MIPEKLLEREPWMVISEVSDIISETDQTGASEPGDFLFREQGG